MNKTYAFLFSLEFAILINDLKNLINFHTFIISMPTYSNCMLEKAL